MPLRFISHLTLPMGIVAFSILFQFTNPVH